MHRDLSLNTNGEPWYCPSCAASTEGVNRVTEASSSSAADDVTPQDAEPSAFMEASLSGEPSLPATPVAVPTTVETQTSSNPGGATPSSLSDGFAALESELLAASAERNELITTVKALEARIRALEACLELTLNKVNVDSKSKTEPVKSKKRKQKPKFSRYSTATPLASPTCRESATSETLVVTELPLENRFSHLSEDTHYPEDNTPPSPPTLAAMPLTLPTLDKSASLEPPAKRPSSNTLSSQPILTQPLFKEPKVKYIWRTTKKTMPDEVTAHIAALGFSTDAFRVERRESTRGCKKVWFFAVLADAKTIQEILAKWSSSKCQWSIKDPVSTQPQHPSFLAQSSLPPKPPYHPQPLFNYLPRLPLSPLHPNPPPPPPPPPTTPFPPHSQPPSSNSPPPQPTSTSPPPSPSSCSPTQVTSPPSLLLPVPLPPPPPLLHPIKHILLQCT